MNNDTPVTILLVGDQSGSLLGYQRSLAELGGRVIRAESARAAQEAVSRNEIGVILADTAPQGPEGAALAGMIRAHARLHDAAVIFLAGLPSDPDRLRATVRTALARYRAARRPSRTAVGAAGEATREPDATPAQEAQALEGLGRLTGAFAHEFNNLLGAIMGNLEMLGRRLPDDPRHARLIAGAMAATERGATLTRRLLAFARREDLRPETVDVPALTAGIMDTMQRAAGPAVQIRTDFAPALHPVRVDPNQLQLALLNLARNAGEAMPGGGAMVVGARDATAEDIPPHGLAPGAYVRLSIADSGIGMDAPTLQRAAEPFFTTKERGTGLGLAMVHGLAAQSGGAMRIVSAADAGTTVEIWLPQANGAAAVAIPAQSAARARRYRVLVVDDDPLLLSGTAAMLADLGHTAVEAGSAAVALGMLARAGETAFDLVITDHAMPGMSGSALAAHLRRHRPELPVILATGYADPASGVDASLPRLSKPYRRNDLAAAIAAALAVPAPGVGVAARAS